MGCLQCGDDAEIYICDECHNEIADQAMPYANGLIKEFLEDLKWIYDNILFYEEKEEEEFYTFIEKWEGRLK